MNIFMGIVTFIGMTTTFFCVFMLFRNKWVYDQRIKILDSDLSKYRKLPDYDTMLNKFWIWNVDKFIKEEND